MGASPVDLDDLFRRYHRELGRFAFRRLGDSDAAADVVQDAFVRYIARTRDEREAAVTPRFFLWRIASNLLIDLARSNARRGPSVSLDDIVDTVADPQPSAERRLAARQEYRRLRRALDELPEKPRAALLLNRVEGMTHAQVAARLGVSPSMVNKYIMRALTHCAAAMLDGEA